jgi:hypothetical protein
VDHDVDAAEVGQHVAPRLAGPRLGTSSRTFGRDQLREPRDARGQLVRRRSRPRARPTARGSRRRPCRPERACTNVPSGSPRVSWSRARVRRRAQPVAVSDLPRTPSGRRRPRGDRRRGRRWGDGRAVDVLRARGRSARAGPAGRFNVKAGVRREGEAAAAPQLWLVNPDHRLGPVSLTVHRSRLDAPSSVSRRRPAAARCGSS